MSFAPLAEACPDSASRPSVPRFVWRVPAGQRTRGLYARAYESVLFPLWQRIVHGRPIGPLLHLLETTERLPREERDRMQLASLRALLDHAGRNVPYWRDLFRRIGFDPRDVHSPGDLLGLPVLTREIMQERYADLVAQGRGGPAIRKGTSGTTGVPLRFEYCNQSEAWRQAIRLRGYGWAGYRLGLPALHYWGAGVAIPKGLRARKIHLDRALRREVYVDAVKQDEASMRDAAKTVSRIRPHAIVGYTQALVEFARWVDEHGLRDWPDVRVLCAAEALLPPDRDALTRTFGPHVFETYGSRETMLIASECDGHDGMHLSEENVIVEIVENGRPAAAGTTGDVLVTDLHNFRMPFIRYTNGDMATMAENRLCACGRTLRKLARVDGRRADTMRTASGSPVTGMVFVSLLQTEVEILRAFQATQKASGEIELKVVRSRQWDADRFAETVRRLREYFTGLPLHVKFCDEIPASSSGKRRPIVVERAAA